MLSFKRDAHEYQWDMLRWWFNRKAHNRGGSGWFADPGLGKTATTLKWFMMLRRWGLAERMLVVAPKKPCTNVWMYEHSDWEEFQDLEVNSLVECAEKHRKAAVQQAVADADITVINPAALDNWFESHLNTEYEYRKKLKRSQPLPWQAIVFDEVNRFKTWGTKRTKAARHLVKHIPNRVVMTGTPGSEKPEELFAPTYLADLGEQLGETIGAFRDEFTYKGGFQGYKHIVHPSKYEEIGRRVGKVCLRLEASDHLPGLPECLYNMVEVDLPPAAYEQYKTFEKKLFIDLKDGEEYTSKNAGTRYNACRQLANGALYIEGEEWKEFHAAKIEMLSDMLEELGRKPVLLAYQFTHDRERLAKYFKGRFKFIDSDTTEAEAEKLLADFVKDKIEILGVHPKSVAEGVNLQKGSCRNVFFFGIPNSLDQYYQLLTRVWRQGVGSYVTVHHLAARNTVERSVFQGLEDKREVQGILMEQMK